MSIHPGCRLCGANAVAVGVITHELVVACSVWAWALKLLCCTPNVATRRRFNMVILGLGVDQFSSDDLELGFGLGVGSRSGSGR